MSEFLKSACTKAAGWYNRVRARRPHTDRAAVAVASLLIAAVIFWTLYIALQAVLPALLAIGFLLIWAGVLIALMPKAAKEE